MKKKKNLLQKKPRPKKLTTEETTSEETTTEETTTDVTTTAKLLPKRSLLLHRDNDH